MANLEFENLVVKAARDVENGLFHVFAEVEGALVPLATHKLGSVLAWIENAASDDQTTPPAIPPLTADQETDGKADGKATEGAS